MVLVNQKVYTRPAYPSLPLAVPVPTHKQATYRAHSERFRQVCNRYSRLVAEAYDDDLDRAARDTDEQVAVTVAAWEREHGIDPVDWHAVGTSEGRDPDRLPSSEPWDDL